MHPNFQEGEAVRETPRAEVPKVVRWRTEYDSDTMDDTLEESGLTGMNDSLVMTKPHKIMNVPTVMIITKPKIKSRYTQGGFEPDPF